MNASLSELRARITAALRRRDLSAAAAAVQQLSARYQAPTGSARTDSRAHAELGDLWSALMDYEAAERCYGRALELAPDQARLWSNRAAVRAFLGRLEAAEADYDRAIELDPQDARSYLSRSELRLQSSESNHIAALERALPRAQGWRGEVPLRYALAKEYEDLGAYRRAWGHLTAGAALRRAHLDYTVRQDVETVSWLRAAFPPGTSAPSRGDESREPIFIVGMPRVGSTLIDRILGSHPEVFSAGELPDFGAAVIEQAQQRCGAHLSRRELIAASGQLDCKALGADYLRRTRPRTGHTACFTDKLPLNYLYLGLIARALPQARIVHVTRDPIGTCYGIFKVLFEQGYPFSYDQIELADYYLAYRELMTHWHSVLPGRIIETRYEALVADLPGEVGRLLTALQLPWEERCLQFERNPAPVATASAAQVRQALHTRAIGQWRHYASELAPLASRLKAGGVAIEAS